MRRLFSALCDGVRGVVAGCAYLHHHSGQCSANLQCGGCSLFLVRASHSGSGVAEIRKKIVHGIAYLLLCVRRQIASRPGLGLGDFGIRAAAGRVSFADATGLRDLGFELP